MTKSSNAVSNGAHPIDLAPTSLQIALWTDGEAALETRDVRGNRALHLALKFAHRNSTAIVKSLLDAGARVRSRDTEGWKAIHHALVSENEEIMRLLICREKEQAPALLQKKIDSICPRLAEVPDFYCEMHIDVSTWVPGVSRWLPSDTVKIWKAAQDIRFDVTLVGYENGKWNRGDLSFLLLGSDGKFLCLDNEAETCTNLLKLDTELTELDLDEMVHFLMTMSIVTTDFDASNVAFEKKCAWFSSTPMLQDIGCWKDTRVVDMIGVKASLRYRKPRNPKHPPPKSIDERQSTACNAVSLLTEVTAAADHYTEVVVDPKSNHVVSLELAKGEEVVWKFSTEKRDIIFGVRFLQENNGDEWDEIIPLQRTQAHLKEQSGSFKTASIGTLVVTWDNSYSLFGERDSPEIDDWDMKTKVKEEEMTFEDWFGLSIESLPVSLRALHPRRCIMVHTQPSCHKITKLFPATVYMSDQFPLSVSEFLPVIELFSKTTRAFESVQEFFSAALSDGFPVQFCFPLAPSVSATFRFDCLEQQTPDHGKFTIPTTYSMHAGDMLSPRTHQVMLQHVTAT
ncbi:GPCR-chaperone [Phytophthora infestans]|uniref:GPCR-chaperone n=1 Tax=Phytophthora infestans TaxID=4787 RepID=A0A833TLZ9_PHYIN|nr:GPCR-chaperone [Phytophthora infestans]